MSVGAAIGLGAVLGLAVGIVVSLTTDVPFAPEAGLVLGALVGWLFATRRARRTR
jgi:Flp pilus assembly protein TadB